MRIREVQTERYLMDAFGLFYELPALVYGGSVWGIRPLSTHLRVCPDFVHWRGLLVLAGDQTDNAVGQPQSGFWFGHIDELSQFGKPRGWGALWREQIVRSGEASEPFLMTGFDKKVLHLTQESGSTVTFNVEVDFLGNGTWKPYANLSVPARGYIHHEFPDAFSAHWVRLKANGLCRVTAQFFYN